MSNVIHGTLIMSGGDIKGGPWPRDVHESSKLRSGLPSPQWGTALATAPCSWQPPPSQVAQLRRGACLAASCPPPQWSTPLASWRSLSIWRDRQSPEDIWWAPLWWNFQAWYEEHFNRICKYAWICSCGDWSGTFFDFNRRQTRWRHTS